MHWSGLRTPASNTLCKPPPRMLVTDAVPHVRTGWTKLSCRSTLALSPSWPMELSPTPPGACKAQPHRQAAQCWLDRACPDPAIQAHNDHDHHTTCNKCLRGCDTGEKLAWNDACCHKEINQRPQPTQRKRKPYLRNKPPPYIAMTHYWTFNKGEGIGARSCTTNTSPPANRPDAKTKQCIPCSPRQLNTLPIQCPYVYNAPL